VTDLDLHDIELIMQMHVICIFEHWLNTGLHD